MSLFPQVKRHRSFFKKFLEQPRSIGALCPSSRFLAAKMVKEAKNFLLDGDYVLELGAGDGSFTREMLRQGIPEEKIICLEIDDDLYAFLKEAFPSSIVIHANALSLLSVLPSSIKGKIGVVISGLPFLNMAFAAQECIVQSCFSVMRQHGSLVQFTYGQKSSVAAKALGLKQSFLGRVWRNIPPACVFSYQKQEIE